MPGPCRKMESKAQWRYMYAKHPKDAKRLAHKTKTDYEDLPEREKQAFEQAFWGRLSDLSKLDSAVDSFIKQAEGAPIPKRLVTFPKWLVPAAALPLAAAATWMMIPKTPPPAKVEPVDSTEKVEAAFQKYYPDYLDKINKK